MDDRPVGRILFIRTDRMGDLLMNLPAISALRRQFKKAWITVMADKSVAELLNGHPDIDEVMAVDAKRLAENSGYWWEWARRVRKARFDLAVVSNPSKRAHLMVFAAGIPRRLGWRRKWGFLLNEGVPAAGDLGGRHQIETNLSLLASATGDLSENGIQLAVSEASARRVENMLKDSGELGKEFIAVHGGTSNPLKRWPAERFAELCDLISETDHRRVVLIGGPEESETSSAIAAQASRKPMDLTGKLTLKELTAFFKDPRIKALVSADSGPVHIAWICGKPVVALYAAGVPGCDPVRWGPRDRQSRVIHKPMSEISSREVLAELNKVLASR